MSIFVFKISFQHRQIHIIRFNYFNELNRKTKMKLLVLYFKIKTTLCCVLSITFLKYLTDCEN